MPIDYDKLLALEIPDAPVPDFMRDRFDESTLMEQQIIDRVAAGEPSGTSVC